jgi:trimethylamine---corrinoid protein Co-methyltransferase
VGKTPCQVLPTEAIEAINKNSLKVLAEVGVEFQCEEALNCFRKAGQRVEKDRVYLQEAFVRSEVSKAPESFMLYGRDQSFNVQIGNGKPVFIPGYGASIVMQGEKRRPAKRMDFVNFSKLSGASQNQQVTGGMLVDPAEGSEDTKYLWMVYDLIKNSGKPYISIPYGKEIAKGCLDIASMVFGGMDAIRARPVTMALVNSLTPLAYDDRMTGALIEYAGAGQPLILSAAAMAGASSPCTLAGTLVVQTAELLAGVVLAQLVREGTPVLYGTASSIIDMRYGTIAMGSPESALLQGASVQIARSWGLPCRGSGFMTDSKNSDAQAGYESTINMAANYFSGADIIVHSAGIIESTMVMSYRKFMLDDEACGVFRRLSDGIAWDAEHLAYELILENANHGAYLTSDHTFRHFKNEFYEPSIFNKQSYETWSSQGAKDIGQFIDEKIEIILQSYEPLHLDEKLDCALTEFIEAKEKV